MTARRLAMWLVLVGCDAQVDPSYPGEALATLRGTTAGFGPDEAAASGAIQWNANRDADLSGPISAAVLHGELPSALTFLVLAPPPETAFFGVDGEGARIAEGYLHLVRRAAAPEPIADDFVGAGIDVALVYVDGTVAAGSLTAQYLGGAPAPGYHLLSWRATADLGAAQAYFAARCAATSTDDCAARRRYQLGPSAADLDTRVTFVGHVGP